MSSVVENNNAVLNNGTATTDHAKEHGHGSHPTHGNGYGAYGGNPLAREHTGESARLPAFGGDFQPGLYRPQKSRLANPAPLGLSAFALTTFVLSLINMGTRSIAHPSIVIALAFGYGGLVQLLAGMCPLSAPTREIAAGNTFGATALASYGGFWISFAVILTPGGFEIEETLGTDFLNSFGLYLMGWFIFTFILLLCTLKSTVAFFLLFFTLDLAFLLLGIGYLMPVNGEPRAPVIKAGGFFGLLAAFLAWYNALAGIADSSNSFFLIPVAHFPWSDKGRERRGTAKTERETV
ncbi:MAG: hypothetical protein M1825_005142 [Sarcosagium campestre]|nr:MAG: hypothetical protein M1825_005142 [Sarcosagium campestre]